MDRATVRQIAGIAAVAALATSVALVASPTEVLESVGSLADRPALLAAALIGLYFARPLVAWPISALSILLGYLFGPVATPVALVGAVVTTLPPYVLARWLGHDVGLLARVGDIGESIRDRTGDFRAIVAVRLAPLPTDPVSYAAGLAGVPLGSYVFGTAVGEAPWVVTAVLLGASMSQLTTTGLSASPLLFVTTVALAVLLVLSRPAYERLSEETAVKT